MHVILALTLVIAGAFAPTAGAPPAHRLHAAYGFGALEREAVRFTSAPSFHGAAMVFEASPAPGSDTAQARLVWLIGSYQRGWVLNRDQTFAISGEDYRRLAGEFDAVFASRLDKPMVCADGDGMLAERNRGGELSWMENNCSEHPNSRISREVQALLRRYNAL